MANVYAVKSGNWSDPTVWNTGALPAAVDNVFSNNFTVTVDGTFTVASISNLASSPAITGGGFVLANGADLTASININSNPGGTSLGYLLGFTSNSPATATFRGNVTVNGAFALNAVRNTGTGTLNVIGSITAGNALAGNTSVGVLNSSSGTVNITGNLTMTIFNGGNSIRAAYNASTGTINITGSVGIVFFNGTPALSGTVINDAGGTVTITGTVTGVSNGSAFPIINSNGTVTVTGLITGGLSYNNTSTFNHFGQLEAGSNAQGGVSSGGTLFATGPFIGTAQGFSALYASRWRWVASVGSSYMTAVNSTATGYKNLYTADSTDSASGQPAATNVRSGTVYGPNSELTGTCAVPPAGSVALGVAVDNTTGTAVLSLSDVQTAATNALTAASAVTLNQPITSLTTPNSIGERFKNSATVATVSQQISDVFSSRQ